MKTLEGHWSLLLMGPLLGNVACSADEHPPFANDLMGNGTSFDGGVDPNGSNGGGGSGSTPMLEEDTVETGTEAAVDFKFSRTHIYMMGDYTTPTTVSRPVMSSASDPKRFIMGWDTGPEESSMHLRILNGDLLVVRPTTEGIIRFTPDYVGTIPRDAADYYPETPEANDTVFLADDCNLTMRTSPDQRLIHSCDGYTWYEGDEVVFHGPISYFGYDGVVMAGEAEDAPLSRVGFLGMPERVFGSLALSNLVRARPNGLFHAVDRARQRLVILDSDGADSVIGQYGSLPGQVADAPEIDAVLSHNDELCLSLRDNSPDTDPNKLGDYLVCCPPDGDCEIVSRAGQPNKVIFLISAASVGEEDPLDSRPGAPMLPTVEEGTTAADDFTFERDYAYVTGTIINPGHDNHGQPATSLFASPWNYILGVDAEIDQVVIHGEAAHYRDVGTSEYRTLTPEYVGRLPSDDADYFPGASPMMNDTLIPTPQECVGTETRIAPSPLGNLRILCNDDINTHYSYRTDPITGIRHEISLDLGAAPGPNSPGRPFGGPDGEMYLEGPVMAVRGLDGGFRIVVREQDPNTFEPRNVWHLWDGNSRLGTFPVPDEYLEMPLASPTSAGLTPRGEIYLAFRDETDESDPARKGDYIVRLDLDGNLAVSRAGNLRVESFFSGP